MEKKVKSPSWAVILLVICVILRLYDSLLFHEKPVRRTGPYQLKWAPLANKRPVLKHEKGSNERSLPADSVLKRAHFLR